MQSNGQAEVAMAFQTPDSVATAGGDLPGSLFYFVYPLGDAFSIVLFKHSKPWPSQIRKLEVMRLSTDLGPPTTNEQGAKLQRSNLCNVSSF